MNEEYAGGCSPDLHDPRGATAARKSDGGILTPLEKMPHIQEKVLKLWGKKDFNVFVQSLMMDTRDGRRQGFPPDAAEDLAMLAEVNTIGRALLVARRMNVPYRDALRKIEAELEVDAGNPFADPMVSRELARFAQDRQGGHVEHPQRRPATESDSATAGVMGFIMSLVLNRYTLILIIALMALRAFWPQLFS